MYTRYKVFQLFNFLTLLCVELSVFDTSLTWQYRIGVGKMGLSREDICKSIKNSISAAYTSDDEKQMLRKVLNDFLFQKE